MITEQGTKQYKSYLYKGEKISSPMVKILNNLSTDFMPFRQVARMSSIHAQSRLNIPKMQKIGIIEAQKIRNKRKDRYSKTPFPTMTAKVIIILRITEEGIRVRDAIKSGKFVPVKRVMPKRSTQTQSI